VRIEVDADQGPYTLREEFDPGWSVSDISAGGAYSEVSLVSEADSAESYGWYRQALTDAGWQVSSEGQTDDTRTLHATQGESYVDLTVMPHPGRGAGWVKVDASIWKSGT